MAQSYQEIANKTARRMPWKYIATIIAIALVFFLVFYSSTILRTVPEHQRTINRIQQSRADAFKAVCAADYDQALRSRNAFKTSTRTFVAAATANPDPSGKKADPVLIQAYLDSQDKVADDAFPLRDCSPEGIKLFYEKNTHPVPPCADNGAGYCK